MNTTISMSEGRFSFEYGAIYYKCNSPHKSSLPPLIVIHGGPGFPHYYLENLRALANERTVVFYDQLGCGRSDKPDTTEYYQPRYFARELDALIRHLGFSQVNLLGHSWGAAVLAEYLSLPHVAIKAIFASPFLSTPIWMNDAKRLVAAFPDRIRETIEKIWSSADISPELVEEANAYFHQHHVDGSAGSHPALRQSVRELNTALYQNMWGAHEFTIDGTLKNYDATQKLSTIAIPTLFTCGECDEATPEACEIFKNLVKGSRVEVVKDAPHAAHLTDEQSYLRIIRDFLNEV